MNDKHELNLHDNAFDYLNEAMLYYSQAKKNNDVRAYKFCILHSVSFAELFLKYYITLVDETRIYVTNSKDKDTKITIKLGALFKVIKDLEMNTPDFFKDEIEKMIALRNDAMHFQISYDEEYVHNQVGKLLYVLIEFDEANQKIDIIKQTEEKFRPLLNIIKEGCLNHEAQQTARYGGRYISDLDCDGINVDTGMECEECGKETLYSNEDGYACSFCEEKFKYRVSCDRCGEEFDSYKDYTGDVAGLCGYCNHWHEKFWAEK